MPFNLTDYDRGLVEGVNIEITGPVPAFGFNYQAKIPVQFPPKIVSDSKDGVWTLDPVNKWEPLAIFMGANARRVSLQLVYVVTGHTQGGVTWSAERVAKVVRDLRSIFYAPAEGEAPAYQLRIYNHIPEDDKQLTFRTISVSEKPGDAVITDNTGTYALKTEVSMELEMWTNIATDKDQHGYPNLVAAPKPIWY